jgi:diguanylate cyclase (GGDEF)-like protein
MAKSEASLTVRTKLLLLVALMNGLLLLAGSFVIARLYLVASSYENFREHTVHFSNINAVVDDLATLRNSLGVGLRANLAANNQWPATASDQIHSNLKSLHVRLDLLGQDVPQDSADLIHTVNELALLIETKISAGAMPAAQASSIAYIVDMQLPAISKQLRIKLQNELIEVDRAQAAIAHGDIRALQYGLIGIGIALIAGLALSYGVFDSVIRPLGVMHKALLQVLSGNFQGLSLTNSDDEIGAIGRVIEDIKTRTEHVYRLAYNDVLTGLPNRLQITRDLTDIARNTGDRRSYGLVLLGADHFAALTSSYGPRFGDEALKAIHQRLVSTLGHSARLYRYTGVMFACLTPSSATDDEAQKFALDIAHSVSDDFKHPLQVGELSIPLPLSIGVALSLNKSRPENMLVEAEAALVEARRRGGGNIVVGERDFAERTRRRLETASAIRRGIESFEFEPFFQPVLDIHKGITVSAETLVRWRQADGSIIMPGEFISVAEESDLIHGITLQMIDRACKQLAQWKSEGHSLRIAFNASARLLNIGLKEIVMGAIARSGIVPSDLEMEITETVVISNHNEAEHLLHELSNAGLKISLDDFGTGYSSMSYLSRFPVDKIKIDAQFVKSLADGPRQREVVATMIQLANKLKIEVVAEGVETIEQMEQLRNMGCKLMQGWLFAPALSADDFASWIKQAPALLNSINQQTSRSSG